MKPRKDIEQQLNELKSNYKVPEDYFSHFYLRQVKKEKGKSFTRLRYFRRYIRAAAIILLMLGVVWFIVSKDAVTYKANSKDTRYAHKSEPDFFSDLSDDEIIEYFVENEDYIDEL